MDKWVDAVKKRGTTISLSDIEIDGDLLNAVQKQQYKDLDFCIMRKEDVNFFGNGCRFTFIYPGMKYAFTV